MTEREARKPGEWQQQVATGTSNLGMVAGPAALYSAVSGRKEGGIPRKLAERATFNPRTNQPTKFGRTRTGQRVRNVAHSLTHNPKNLKRYKIGAGVAGGTVVGLQAANWLGDTIVARSMAQKKQELGKADRTTRFKTEEDLLAELKRQRDIGRNTALMQASGIGAGVGGAALVRRQYSPADREAIRDARVRAFWNNAGRRGLNRRAIAGSALALGGSAVALGAGRVRDQQAKPWR